MSKKQIPKLLKEINDPPQKLYMRGKLKENTTISITGSSKPTEYGVEITKKIIQGLSKYPVSIATGLSIGIEELAIEEALKSNIHTIGIYSGGLKHGNELMERIVQSGGLLLSEEEPDFVKTKESKEKSLRIIAGVSEVIIVIETERKSSPMIIADLAMGYNREVCTFPGSIFSETSTGPHYLIRNGATPITSLNDLLEVLGFEKEKEEDKELSKKELDVVKILLSSPMSKEELQDTLEISYSECDRLLSILSLKDIITFEMGEVRINLPK